MATEDELVPSCALGYISRVIPEREHSIAHPFSTLVLSVLFLLSACGSSDHSLPPSRGALIDTLSRNRHPDAAALSREQREDFAVRHYISGSAREEAGDYTGAINAFEQALAYDASPAIHLALSRVTLETGRFIDATHHAQEAVRLSPADLRAHEQLADVYLASGEHDSAVLRYEIMFRLDSTNEQTRYMLARLYHTDKPARALELYESILQSDGGDEDVRLNMAELHIDMHEYARATAILESLRRFDADNDYLLTLLADTYSESGQREHALSVVEDLCRRFPEQQRPAVRLAGMYADMDRWQDAHRIFDGLLGRDSLDTEALADIGELYYQRALADTSLLREADSMYTRLRQRFPGLWQPWWYAGALAFTAGRMSEAVEHFSRVLDLDPENVETLEVLARAYLSLDDPASAIKPLLTLSDWNLADAETYSFLGYAYQRLGKDSLAIDALGQALALEPGRVDALTTLALLHDDAGRTDRSDALYEEALRAYADTIRERDAAYFLLANNYAYSLSSRGKSLDRALAMSREAVRFDSTNGSYLDTFGWIQYRLGRLDSAITYLSRAIAASQADPNPVFLEHLGDIYLAAGDRETAIALWKQGRAIDPGNATLDQKIRAIQP